MPAPPSRGCRLLTAVLTLGCVAMSAFIVQAVVAEPAAAVPPARGPSPVDFDSFIISPGHWTLLPDDQPRGCPLVPPGCAVLCERRDAADRVSAVFTEEVELAAARRHWQATGWTVAELDDADIDPRPLLLSRNTDRALVWPTPADQPGTVQLLLTVIPQAR